MTNLNHVANYCMDNLNHPMFKATDGARCVVCNSLVNIMPVTATHYRELPSYEQLRKEHKPKPSNEIAIVMEHPNKRPKVVLNGTAIEGIIELQYNYDTSTHESPGQHNFTVKYIDKESNAIRTVGTNKVWEG